MLSIALAALLALSPARASGISSCRYTGTITAVEGQDGGELVVTLQVESAEPGGHSAAPALCEAPGAALRLDITDDERGRAMGLSVGERVSAEVADIFNFTAEGPRRFHEEAVRERLPAAPQPPAP